MFAPVNICSGAGAPLGKYPIIIEQFLGINGLGNGGSSVFPLDIEAMQELSTVDIVLTASYWNSPI